MKCLILAGGSGDRLWPLSRRSYPKQFVEIKENRSFLQETILRNMPFCDEFLIVTNEKYRFIVEGQLQAFQGLKARCYFEELSRGTALPIALISMLQNPSELLLVTAADMAVNSGGYRDSMLRATEYARGGNITIVGMPITKPATRYGYIRHNGENVSSFIEKPLEREAEIFAGQQDYLWNSGIFVAKSEAVLNQLEQHMPEFYNKCHMVASSIRQHSNEVVFKKEQYDKFPLISIEKAIFEKSQQLKVIAAEFKWQDMDTLEDVFPFTKRDEKNTIINQCDNVSVINRTSRQLVVANDVTDVMVVNTPDVVYVSGKNAADKSMRTIMAQNEDKYFTYFDTGQLIYRPWGYYEILSQEKGFRVKKVTVFPGKNISAHRHEHRSEHWSVVSGSARIILNDKEKEYGTNDSVYLEKGITHEVYNDGTQDLIIVEVGIGEKLADNDTEVVHKDKSVNTGVSADSIVKLEPAFKDYLWGGMRLKSVYNKKCDYDAIAESWELSAHPDGQSVVSSGRFSGMLFNDYIKRIGKDKLGWKAELYEEFPILIKLIDAHEPLSIQVHPDDDFAMKQEHEYGKNEMWHIIDCEDNAYIYCGFKNDVTRQQVLDAIANESLINLLNKYEVRQGDTIFIPAGTVHAIGAGIVLCEIQQSSNSTYRLYDYARKDKFGKMRELHLEKALQVIDTNKWCNNNIRHEAGEKIDGGVKDTLVECKYFETIKYIIDEQVEIKLDDTSFAGLILLSGKAHISTGDIELNARAGDTFFIPAGQITLGIRGRCSLLITRI